MSSIGTVVGWDGSTAADGALEWAAHHAERTGGGLRVVRVLPPGTSADPAAQVAGIRASLEAVVAMLAGRWPSMAVAAELRAGDAAAELSRAAGHDDLLVVGASHGVRIRQARAREVPVALAARAIGITAIVPEGSPAGRAGVLGVVCGHEHSRATAEFALAAAVALEEPLTLVRLHDPYDLDVATAPIRLDLELDRLRDRAPGVDIRLAPGFISSPYGLLARSDAVSLLVLEGARPSAAPPRYSFERWLAAQARAPFAVVTERLRSDTDVTDRRFALAV